MEEGMAKSVEFFFDVGSPASYLAWTQLPALCRATGGEVIYRPMLLGGVFQATGNSSPAAIPAKGPYAMKDLMRHARRYGVPFAPNPHFPINTLALMRATAGVQESEPQRLEAFLQALFRAIWVDSLNLNDAALVRDVLKAQGFDPAQVETQAGDPATKAALRATTEEAVNRGVFGAPTFFVNGEMFFGQDRLDFVREALATASV
jgi:2-hydroxychromene-2-carboxylate isomerase